MMINIKSILVDSGESVEIDEMLPMFTLDDCTIDKIHAVGKVINNAGRIELLLTVSFVAASICARCGISIALPFTTEIDEPVSGDLIDNNRIMLSEIVTSEISLSLPLRFLCKPDCRGLCESCGVNLNEEKCNCDTEIIDERLLKLKQLLKKED